MTNMIINVILQLLAGVGATSIAFAYHSKKVWGLLALAFFLMAARRVSAIIRLANPGTRIEVIDGAALPAIITMCIFLAVVLKLVDVYFYKRRKI